MVAYVDDRRDPLLYLLEQASEDKAVLIQWTHF